MKTLIVLLLCLGLCWSSSYAEDVSEEDIIFFEEDNYSILPIYDCSIHGEIDFAIFVFEFEDTPELNGNYCPKCIAEFMRDNFQQLERK